MALAFTIWLCGAIPAAALAFDCLPRRPGEWLGAALVIALWPIVVIMALLPVGKP